MDKPDPGIDIVYIGLPAFRNGQGIYYSIYYYTYRGGLTQHMLAENISASRPQSFQVPRQEAGNFITAISIATARRRFRRKY